MQFYPVAAAGLYDALVSLDTTTAAVKIKSRAGPAEGVRQTVTACGG
jgi:hypothetical protein